VRRKVPEYVRALAKELRKNQTAAEQRLWQRIKNKQLGGFRFLRQYIIDRYIADFYCSKAKLAIEIDGGIHNDDDIKAYDQIRENAIKTHGIRVIRFTNDEIFSNLDNVLEQLLAFLKSDLRCNASSLQNNADSSP